MGADPLWVLLEEAAGGKGALPPPLPAATPPFSSSRDSAADARTGRAGACERGAGDDGGGEGRGGDAPRGRAAAVLGALHQLQHHGAHACRLCGSPRARAPLRHLPGRRRRRRSRPPRALPTVALPMSLLYTHSLRPPRPRPALGESRPAPPPAPGARAEAGGLQASWVSRSSEPFLIRP